MNLVDKYLEKHAAFDWKTPAINAGVGAGTLGALSAGTAAVAFGAKSLYDAVTKRRDFRSMLDNNPDLHEHLQRDPKMFNQAYSSLRHVNMQFAAEPLIAGNYMRQIMESPMHAGGKIELALLGGQGQHGAIDRVSDHMFEGARGGMQQQHDPHSALRHEVAGMQLNKQKSDLNAPPDPNAHMEHAVKSERLKKQYEAMKNPDRSSPPGWAGGGGKQQPGLHQQMWLDGQAKKERGARAPSEQRDFGF